MPINLDDLKKEFDQIQNRQTGFFIPQEGESVIRILPSWDSLFPSRIFKKVGRHNIFGEKYICPRETNNEACPICDHVFKLYRSAKQGKPEDANLAKELRAIQRFYWNIVVRGQEDKGVQKFECGSKLTDKIMSIMLKELMRDITDPAEGHDLVVVKKMNGEYPDYTSSYVRLQPSLLGNDEWLDHLNNFDQDFKCKSADELREVLVKALGPTVSIAPPTTITSAPKQFTTPVYTPPPAQVAPTPQPAPVQAAQVAQPAPVQAAPVQQPQASSDATKPMDAVDILNMLK